jgi:hypothetical protein
MIQLARNPIEGGSVIIRLSFKDQAGIEYEPVEGSVYFTLYAHHEADNFWDIVNGREDVPLESASIVDIVFHGDDLALLPSCTTKRRVIINWVYLRNGEETLGRDSVDFHVTPLPVVAKV